MVIIGFLFAAIISIVPFPILAILYKIIPDQVPLFVDMVGNPTIMAAKSFLSVYRLPTMGLMIQIICSTMYLLKFGDKEKIKTNRKIWLAISIIGAIKMSLTSLEVLIYQNQYLLSIFRTSVSVIVIVAVVILLINLNQLYKIRKSGLLKEYHSALGQWHAITIIFALSLYILIAVLPIIIKF